MTGEPDKVEHGSSRRPLVEENFIIPDWSNRNEENGSADAEFLKCEIAKKFVEVEAA
jgi:hypothetical protein